MARSCVIPHTVAIGLWATLVAACGARWTIPRAILTTRPPFGWDHSVELKSPAQPAPRHTPSGRETTSNRPVAANSPNSFDAATLFKVWYTYVMSINFGSGVPLNQTVPELRDPQSRREIILDVVERNSVIEGLPPFTSETRERIRKQLSALSASEAPTG